MKKIVKMVFGSHMYGLNTPNSDMDYKGIYLPELDDLLLGTHAKHISHSTGDDLSKNTADDVDDEWYSLDEFIKLATKGETVALDMLHVNPELVTVEVDPEHGWIWEDLVAKRDMFYTKNLKAYMGYVKRQAAKYGLKGSRISAMREAINFLEGVNGREVPLFSVWDNLPENEYARKEVKVGSNNVEQNFYVVNGKMYQDTNTVEYVLERINKALNAYGHRALLAEKNEGVDWKAVSHALRAGYQLKSIFVNGSFGYPLAETEFLRGVKEGIYDYKTAVSPVLEHLVEEIDSMVETVDLPAKVNVKYWNEWLLQTYWQELIIPAYAEANRND